jgi:hypothetical protein
MFWTDVEGWDECGRMGLVAAVGVLAMAGLIGGCGGGPETGGSPAPAPAASSAVGEYHCEMHPEVVSSKPGTCPRCKMTLTKK